MKIFLTLLKILFIVLLGYYLFYNVNIIELFKYIKSYSLGGMALTLTIVVIGDLLAGYRFYYLCEKCKYLSVIDATMLSFVANTFSPAKLGEVSKIIYLNKKENIKKRTVFSLMVLEKFTDIIMLLIFLLFATLLFDDKKFSLFVVLLLAAFILVLAIIRNRRFTSWALKKIPMKQVKIYLYLFIKEFRIYLKNGRLPNLFSITTIIWIINILINLCFFYFATNIEMSLKMLYISSLFAFAAAALPLTPGGIGTFQAAFLLVLSNQNIPKEALLAATFVLQFFYILPSLIYVIYLLYLKDLKNVLTSKL